MVVPGCFHNVVLQTAHDACGPLGIKETYDCVLRYFFLPRLKRDVAKYEKTRHICQITGKSNQKIKPAPLSLIHAMSQPFEYLIIDYVELLPPSRSGCVYMPR